MVYCHKENGSLFPVSDSCSGLSCTGFSHSPSVCFTGGFAFCVLATIMRGVHKFSDKREWDVKMFQLYSFLIKIWGICASFQLHCQCWYFPLKTSVKSMNWWGRLKKCSQWLTLINYQSIARTYCKQRTHIMYVGRLASCIHALTILYSSSTIFRNSRNRGYLTKLQMEVNWSKIFLRSVSSLNGTTGTGITVYWNS